MTPNLANRFAPRQCAGAAGWGRAGAAAAFLAAMLVGNGSAFAEEDATPSGASNPIELLSRIQHASRKLDYSGVFMYQQGEFTLSSRLIHVLDGTGERERLEILDGPPREYLRHNDDVQCLMPERKTVMLERRRGDRFPGLLLGDPFRLAEFYEIKADAKPHRVAGRACRIITVEPRDTLRYGYRLCADVQTDLLLKAQTLNSERAVVEQVVFTSLRLADEVDRTHLNSHWKTNGWKIQESSIRPVDITASGWRVSPPAGFIVLMQVARTINRHDQVSQLVLSDGLAVISLFIEPYNSAANAHQPKGAGRRGAINVFGRRIADYWLTVVGAVPAATLRRVAESTEYVPLAASR